MKAVILPNDEKTPEQALKSSMTEIGGAPMLFHTLMLLKKYDFEEAIILNNTESPLIRECVSAYIDRLDGMKIRILRVPSHYKSAKMIRVCKKYLLENAFFVAPNDVITDLNIKKMIDFHRKNANVATMLVAKEKRYFSALGQNEDNDNESKLVNSGFYAFESEGIDYMEKNLALDSEILVRIAQDAELGIYSDNSFIQRCI